LPYAVAPIVRHHHENWDGSGYPDGLSGDHIPIGARILAVVDCFDALTSDRPYRPRLEDHDALKILADRRGTMYDPRVVTAFFALHQAQVADPAAPPASSLIGNRDHARQPPGTVKTGGDKANVQAVFDLGRAVGASAERTSLGEILWTTLGPRLPASVFVLYVYDAADDAVVPLYSSDADAIAHCADRIPLGERLSGWVAATRQTIQNSDARLDFDVAERENSPFRCALAVPVVRDHLTVAVLSFYGPVPNAFDNGHRRVVEAAADAIASAPISFAALKGAVLRPQLAHAAK